MRQLSLQSAIARHLGLTLGAIGFTAVVAVVSSLPVYGAQLIRWQFDPQTRQLEIVATGGTQPNYFVLAQPPRIVIDLPDTTVGPVLAERSYSGLVRQIRVNQFQPTLTRIVIELDPDAEFSANQVQMRSLDSQASRWLVQPVLAGKTPAPLPSLVAPPESPDTELLAEQDGAVGEDLTAIVGPEATGNGTAVAGDEQATSEAEDSSSTAALDSMPPLEPGAQEINVDLDVFSETDSQFALGLQDDERPTPDVNSPWPTAAGPAFDGEAELAPAPTSEPSVSSDAALGDAPTDSVPSGSAADLSVDPSPPSDVVVELGDSPRPSTSSLGAEDRVAEDTEEIVPAVSPPSEVAEVDTAIAAVSSPPPADAEAAVANTADFPPPVEDSTMSLRIDAPSSVLLPAGTVLQLRYPRTAVLGLAAGESRQEILLTLQVIQDAQGNVILPAGTQIIGRFESNNGQGRFIAQALVSPEGNRPLVGISELDLDRRRLQVEPNQRVELQVTEDLLKP